MADLSSLMASANPQQAAAHFASLYFGIPRAFFPSNIPPHLSSMNSAANSINADIATAARTSSAGYPVNNGTLTNQALYTTRLQLSGLYPGLRFHPYFQPRLVHPTPTTKSSLEPTTDCDTMNANI